MNKDYVIKGIERAVARKRKEKVSQQLLCIVGESKHVDADLDETCRTTILAKALDRINQMKGK